eukprot:CAMPEP_0177332630 /NCGR_PEP_ID=MMETSP0368-20130122/21697_1 /TAXON_ID=447022 ORGANISM="Scrippsiella hangoei-like, Strain SHHI-4" /NCGR_SAMPLE_ID=MMETSP0368 /ASSEMBLY_ACC=CAM_ASM_000363 /LENGTH=309 /DNA_ID=CAMNT_0018793113 /DNA_START=59 /DNA_END=988 /DNA_ORIENTATION=-
MAEAACPDDEASPCAICYEPCAQSVDLPCQCKVDYCASCWDRALAKSFNSCAQARCPTCRAPVRVDYDDASDRLTFGAQVELESADGTRVRLAQQLRPRQIRILAEFAAQHGAPLPLPAEDPPLADGVAPRAATPPAPASPAPPTGTLPPAEMPSCASGPPPSPTGAVASAPPPPPTGTSPVTAQRERSRAVVVAAVRHATCLAQAGQLPRCVCGAALELISVQERARRFMQQAESWRTSQALAPLLQRGAMKIVCDLCNQPMSMDGTMGKLWACERGDGTIKHATSNDICMACFIYHAFGVDVQEQLE